MPAYADLEITLGRKAEKTYTVVLRFNEPDSDDDKRWPDKDEWDITIDFAKFRRLEGYIDEYGTTLFGALFQGAIGRTFQDLRGKAKAKSAILRVRLVIEPGAAELHNLHWEAMREPDSNELLFAGEQVVLSRYLTSMDWTPIRSRPRSDLNALVVIANGSDLKDYSFAEVRVAAETAMAKEALGSQIKATFLHEGPNKAATLDNIVKNLRGFDILYMVCHGMLQKLDDADESTWEPKVMLESADGKTAPTSGVEFVNQIKKLQERPRLVVMASCQSDGNAQVRDAKDFSTIAAALGPQLAQAGIPAVIAMRGNVSMTTSGAFMKEFFEQLAQDGQIDRAVGMARNAVRIESDSWMPALYMRLRSGRVWYVPGFEKREGFDQWDSIAQFVHSGKFVPIIGPELSEQVVGSGRDLSEHLADKNGFPLSSFERNDTAKVAQYVLTKSSKEALQTQVKGFWLDHLLAKYPSIDDEDPDVILDRLAKLQYADESNPYKILADLKKASVYVNASPDGMLQRVLLETQKKKPVELIPKWRDERKEGGGEPELDDDPTPDKPLLFYAYGKYTLQDTWVLAEDDFFDYMIRASKYKLIPSSVGFALCTNSLMFLGFPLDDWKFRIFFRMILDFGGSELIRNLARARNKSTMREINHIGVQVNPDETSLADANRARKYLESYFKKASNIDIYWGTATDFLRQLKDELAKRPPKRTL